MGLDASQLTIWDRVKYGAHPFTHLFGYLSSLVFYQVRFALYIANSLAVVLLLAYSTIPPIVDRIATYYLTCANYFGSVFTKAQDIDQSVETVVGEVSNSSVGAPGIWELVKYLLNFDALSDSIDFILGVGFMWILLVVLVFLFATLALCGGFTIWATRRAICFASASFIKF